jgi:hypothetical protein
MILGFLGVAKNLFLKWMQGEAVFTAQLLRNAYARLQMH